MNLFSSKNIYSLYLPLGLVLLNFILKFFFIDYWAISEDEPYSIFFTQGNLDHLHKMLEGETTPPLFYYFLHYWIKLFGTSVISVRMPSVLFSSLIAGMIYFTGKRFINLRVAIASTILFSLSDFHLYISHDTRVYSLFILLTICSYYLFMSMYKRFKKYKFLLFTLINLLMIYSHLFGIFVILTQGIILLIFYRKKRGLFFAHFFSSLLVGLMYLPYFLFSLKRLTKVTTSNWVPFPSIESLYNNLWSFSNAPVVVVLFLLIMATALFFYSFNKKDRVDFYKLTMIFSFIVTYLIMFLTSYKTPIFLDKYLVFTSIGLYFSVIIGLDYLIKNKKIFWSASILLFITMGCTFSVDKRKNNEPTAIAKYIKKYKDENTSVIIIPEWKKLEFMYHYDSTIFHTPSSFDDLAEKKHIFSCLSISDIKEKDWDLPHVLFVDFWSDETDPEQLTIKALNDTYNLTKTNKEFHHLTIYHFSRND